MFARLSTLALLLPFVAALTINAPTGPTTGSPATITWTATTDDPQYFSIELVNTAFHNTYAIANNVQTSLGSLTLELPQVPVQDGYSLQAVATNDITQVYSTSGTFSIGAATSSSTTAASTTSTDTSSTSSGTITPLSTTISPLSSTLSSVSTAASSSAASTTPSSLSGGAASFKLAGVAPVAALVLSVVAGAAMVF